MNNLVNELLGGGMESSGNNNNNSVFFTEDGPEGFVSKAEFLSALHEIKRTPAVKQLEKAFDNLNAGRSLNGYPTKDYLDSQQVIWVRFSFGKIKQNIPVPAIAGMYEFLMAYANGYINSVKTLTELIMDAAPES